MRPAFEPAHYKAGARARRLRQNRLQRRLRATYVAAASSHRSVDRVGNAAIEHSTRVLVAPRCLLPQSAIASQTRLPAHSCGITEIFIAVDFAVRSISFAM